MALKMLDAASVMRTITSLSFWNGTALVPLKRLKFMDTDGTTIRTVAVFAQPLAATVSPSPVSKTQIGSPGDSVTTGTVTVTATGGHSPMSYAWTLTAYSSAVPPTIGSPTNASTTFTQSAMDFEETATFQCVVTDFEGATVTLSVNVTFRLTTI